MVAVGRMTIALYFAIAFVLSLALTPICRSGARRLGLTARPTEDRWHQQPTALLGGVAIALPTLVLGATLPLADVWLLLVCGLAIAVFGGLDDLLSFKASTKLVVQIALASLLVFFGNRLNWTASLTGDLMLTLLWVVGITNAFNLLDNMDGLCAGTAIVAGGFTLAAMAGSAPAPPVAVYLAALLGATAGFLVYNFHPASIFMGDTGSLFLGLNLATITLVAKAHGAANSGLVSATAAPVLLLLVPILDTTLVTAVRLLSGRNLSQGGRDHTSHRLVAIGLSQRYAVAVLWLLSAAGGAAALALRTFDSPSAAMVTVTLLLASMIFGVYLARIRVYDETRVSGLQRDNVTLLVADFMHKRRVAEVLLDLCLVSLSYYAAYRLRFDGPALLANFSYFLQSLPVVVAAQIVALFAVGGYRGAWHQFGMMDAVVFAKGIFLGALSAQTILLYVYRFGGYSRAVFVIYAVLLLVLLCASRASFRLLSEFALRRQAVGRRCVVYGTGSASVATIREAFGDRPLRFVGFIDDDPRQNRARVSGYSVLGNFSKLWQLVEGREVDCVVLNTRGFDADRLRALEAHCQSCDVELLRLQINVKPVVAAS
jgi:UDP-GlcNAc:undecaprenyl-phosphate GlcNAc-1-phosphate transferase